MQTKKSDSKQTRSSVIKVSREHKTTVEHLMAQSNKKLIIYALGIFCCFFYYGILQEKITRTKYGENKEFFKCTVALVFIQCVINAIFAKIVLSTVLQQPHDTTRTSYYVVCAFTYLAAMVSSNMALIHVNYPTQVIGKSCKPIPVMILGVLIARKSYSLLKYFFVFTIVVGVGIFMYKDGHNKSSSTADSTFIGAGEMLLLFSLLMDGFTGAVQERMKTEHQTKSGHMMLNMNLWSILFLGIALITTGELWRFIDFVGRYPFVVYYILGFSFLSAFGQLFIFLTVTEFGPLPCSIITTTRKFFTVLASVLLFGNVLSERQWLGAFMVFTGLTLDSIYGKSAPKTK